jgi:hypothetical protein
MAKNRKWFLSWVKTNPLRPSEKEIVDLHNSRVQVPRGTYLEIVRKEFKRREKEKKEKKEEDDG